MLHEDTKELLEKPLSKYQQNKFESSDYVLDKYSAYSQVFNHITNHFVNIFRRYGVDITKIEKPRASKAYQEKNTSEKEKAERQLPVAIAIHEKDGIDEYAKLTRFDDSTRMDGNKKFVISKVRYKAKGRHYYNYKDGTNFKLMATENVASINGLISVLFDSEIKANNFFRQINSDFIQNLITTIYESRVETDTIKHAIPYHVRFAIPDATLGSIALNMSELSGVPVEEISSEDIVSFMSLYSEFEFMIHLNPGNNTPEICVEVPRFIDVKINSITKGSDVDAGCEAVKIEYTALYGEFNKMQITSVLHNKLNYENPENWISGGKMIDYVYKPKLSERMNYTINTLQVEYEYSEDDFDEKGMVIPYSLIDIILSKNSKTFDFIEYRRKENYLFLDKFNMFKYFAFEIKRTNFNRGDSVQHIVVGTDEFINIDYKSLMATDTFDTCRPGDKFTLVVYLNLVELKLYHRNVVLGSLDRISKDISAIKGSDLANQRRR